MVRIIDSVIGKYPIRLEYYINENEEVIITNYTCTCEHFKYEVARHLKDVENRDRCWHIRTAEANLKRAIRRKLKQMKNGNM